VEYAENMRDVEQVVDDLEKHNQGGLIPA